MNNRLEKLSSKANTSNEAFLGYLNNIYWYNKTVIEDYISLGSLSEFESKTGINKISAGRSIIKSIYHIKQMAATA